MKIVILAAGMGKRLGMSMPKALIPLKEEKVILDYQIDKLLKFIPIKDIIVVVGYKKELVINRYPDLYHVHNDRFAQTNTSKSLLLALNEVKDSDVLWLNGDVYFDHQVIKSIIRSEENCMLADNEKCGEEEVKYTTDQQGYINQISKEVEKPEGEALGINLVKSKNLAIFRKHLTAVDDDDYFEKAIENMILQDNVKVKPINVGNHFCQEIDFPTDLENVKNYIRNNNI